MRHQNRKILLVNMGAIEKSSDILQFLFNMFNDRFILPLPQPLRFIIASTITALRFKETWKILKTTPSPLKNITKRQAKLLEKLTNIKTEAAFVYSKPKIKKTSDTEVIAMYNFYSHTTHGKILEEAKRIRPPFCIYNEFFDMVKNKIENKLKGLNPKKTAVLLSAHSIPEKLAKKDSYTDDLAVFRRYLDKRLASEVFLSFQSKLGPVKWLRPTTEEMIKKLSKNYENLVIFPISFTAENTETINEIDIVYQKLAYQKGFKRFERVSCFNDEEDFIKFLSQLL